MSNQFSTGPTRNVQAGDTPDLNDGLLSRSADSVNIQRGQACVVKAGVVTIGVDTDIGFSPFVPVESVDNTGGGLPIDGVAAPQRVALAVEVSSAALNPDDYVKLSTTPGEVLRWAPADNDNLKYARYLGKEAALLDRNALTPFDETLTPGVVPDQILTPVADDNIGWFQLMETQGGGIT